MSTHASKRKKRGRPAREYGVLPSIFRLSRAETLMMELVSHSELDKLRDGTASEATWHTLAARINLGSVMASMYFERDTQDIMTAAVYAIASVGKRYRSTGRMGMTGDEYVSLCDGLACTDEMQSFTTTREQARALSKVFALATARGRVETGQVIDIPEAR